MRGLPACSPALLRFSPSAARNVVMLAAAASPFRGVDNLLAASNVREQLAAGATLLRIEADFVTCSQ